MNIKSRVVNSVAAAAMLLGMTGGMVVAQADTDDGDALLNVVCTPATTVTVEMGDAFEVDLATAPGDDGYSASVDHAATITADLTCNENWPWGVRTDISDFSFMGPGSLPAGKAASFSGAAYTLTNGTLVDYTGPDGSIWFGEITGPPFVNPTVHPRSGILGDIAMGSNLFTFNLASPGVSIASWGGELEDLPENLAIGTYKADLVVTLYIP